MKLIFYRGSGKLWDRLIKWWTGGKYSHCELVFSDGTCFSADAWENKVRYKYFEPDAAKWDTVELWVIAKQEVTMRAWCDSKVGKKYDWLGLLGFILPIKTEDPNRYFCSELCVEALQKISRFVGRYGYNVNPVQLGRLYGLR